MDTTTGHRTNLPTISWAVVGCVGTKLVTAQVRRFAVEAIVNVRQQNTGVNGCSMFFFFEPQIVRLWRGPRFGWGTVGGVRSGRERRPSEDVQRHAPADVRL